MTKLFNTTLFTKGSEYWLGYYTEEKPSLSDALGYSDAYGLLLKTWKASFKEVRIHSTQERAFNNLAFKSWTDFGSRGFFTNCLKEGISLPPDNIEIREVDKYVTLADNWLPIKYAFLNAVDKEEKPIQLGDPMYNGKCKICKCLTCICDPSPSEHNKEEFYKYGASLGIKINDLQRLAMLLKPSEHIQTQEGWEEVTAIVSDAFVNKDSLTETIEKLKTKFKLIRK